MKMTVVAMAAAALTAVPGAARAAESTDGPCTIEPGTSNSVVVDCGGPDVVVGSRDCNVTASRPTPITIDPSAHPPFFTMDPEGAMGHGVHCPIG